MNWLTGQVVPQPFHLAASPPHLDDPPHCQQGSQLSGSLVATIQLAVVAVLDNSSAASINFADNHATGWQPMIWLLSLYWTIFS
jgi:hypothetical protein